VPVLNLQVNNLSFAREDVNIFSNISFSVQEGQIIWIKGSNGSGKTTLIRILSGIIKNFSGEILFCGENIKNNYNDYYSYITYIGHKLACYNDRTVIENLKFWAKIRNTSELLEPAMHFFSLNRISDVQLKKLSSGWQKRVCLARLLLFNSRIWLLDEPFVNLDKKSRELLISLFKLRLNQGGIIIIASHDDFKIDSKEILELNLD
jgi:heme exporter protein A